MATSGDETVPYKDGAAGDNSRKRPFRTEIYEEPQNVSQEAGQNVSTHQSGNIASISVTFGKSELEQMLKQMTFTRFESQHYISLMHSRTIKEESPTPLLRLEASTTPAGSMKRHKNGDESHNFHASVVTSRVLEEEIALPADLANANKGSTICRQDSTVISNKASYLPITSMASPKRPATMENLPEEILLKIFIRLLAKQLAQMRSVNKSWNALLSHPSFIKSHFNHSIRNNNRILLVFHDDGELYSGTKPFTAKPTQFPCLKLTNFIKLPVNPHPEYINGIKIIGSVNGLICSCYGDSVIHIWNPSLSAVLTLPPYSTPSHDNYSSIRVYFRFGYDPKTDDYKVIKFTGLSGLPMHAIMWWLDVEIYSMRKGSWKLITERFPSHITRIYDNNIICLDGHDGHLHWLACTGEKIVPDRILAFDLGSETFSAIPLPHSTLDQDRHNILGVLAEKLSVISCIKDDTYEVWVMNEYGVAESWVKRHVFSQFRDDAWPFGFTSHNEFLIEGNGFLVLYDPSTNEQKVLEDHCPEERDVDNIVEYVDSLVWIVPAEHEMVDGGGQI